MSVPIPHELRDIRAHWRERQRFLRGDIVRTKDGRVGLVAGSYTDQYGHECPRNNSIYTVVFYSPHCIPNGNHTAWHEEADLEMLEAGDEE